MEINNDLDKLVKLSDKVTYIIRFWEIYMHTHSIWELGCDYTMVMSLYCATIK